MRHADTPTVEVATTIDAPPAAVWALVTDIGLPARFSDEFQGATWLEPAGGPAAGVGVGSTFQGRNRNEAMGQWEVVCTVTEWVEDRSFGWVVGDPSRAVASWRFDLAPDGQGTRLSFWARMGPGPSGVTMRIERHPEAEEQIVEARLGQWRTNMTATLAGIAALAEGRTG